MANLNKVFLIGRLTRDPEYKEFEGSGTKVCDLGLATSRNWRDKQSGEKKEETTFVDIKVWGRQAEIANQYLNKGREVMIEGRLEWYQWDDKNTGAKRSKLRVVADRIQFLGGRGDGDNEGGGGRSSRGYGQSYGGGDDSYGQGYDGGRYGSGGGGNKRSGNREPARSSYDDDDIPF